MTLSALTVALATEGIENADWEARLLFSHYGGYTIASLLATDPVLDCPALEDALSRRLGGEPLQYILGEVEFCHEVYHVSPACLIPRPDTELLVEHAIRLLPRGAHFADLCTGSGCIAISTLAARTDTHADAYDISEGALALAAENATRNGVSSRISFSRRDLLITEIDGMYDAILSNPPYIPPAVIDTLAPELSYEPRIALDGGEDGMDFYRAILARDLTHVKAGGFLLMEIGYDQAAEISALADQYGLDCRIEQDLGGNDRLAILKKKVDHTQEP